MWALTDICIALRHPDGFTLPHNLVRETILWEMSALFNYCSHPSLCFSWLFPPVSPHCAEHNGLKEGNKSEGLDSSDVAVFVIILDFFFQKKVTRCLCLKQASKEYLLLDWMPVIHGHMLYGCNFFSSWQCTEKVCCFHTEKINTFSIWC